MNVCIYYLPLKVFIYFAVLRSGGTSADCSDYRCFRKPIPDTPTPLHQ
eukprot:SAG25_NODE_7115_length_503_cov_1.247525_1_plen_47_part_10